MEISLKMMRKPGFNSLSLKNNKKKIDIINSKSKFSNISSCPICKSKKKREVIIKWLHLNCARMLTIHLKNKEFSDLYSQILKKLLFKCL